MIDQTRFPRQRFLYPRIYLKSKRSTNNQIEVRKMRLTTITSAAAIAIGLGLSGAASAATLVGGVTVTDIDLPTVQARCDQMADPTAMSVDSDLETSTSDGTASDQTSKTIGDITMQDCVDAGLLPADTVIPEASATK